MIQDSMIWVKCPKCSGALGFSSIGGIKRNGIFFATLKSESGCGYCKFRVPTNKWLLKTNDPRRRNK